jgi:hypothetical protein
MSQPQPSNDINNQNAESNFSHLNNFPTDCFISILVQNETNDIPLNTSLPDNTADIIETYASPTLIKSLEKTIHPRTLKEFAKTGSSPIQCVNSNQRDPVPIKVGQSIKNLKMNIQITFRFHLMTESYYTWTCKSLIAVVKLIFRKFSFRTKQKPRMNL